TRKIDDLYSFGLTIMATRAGFTDDGLTSRCTIMPTTSTDNPENYNLIPPYEWLEIGKMLQRKMLLFRLRHMGGKMPTQLLLPGITSFRVRESLLILQGLKDEDPTITNKIVDLAKKMQEQTIIERAASPDGLVLNAVYNFLRDPTTVLEKWKCSFIPILTMATSKKKKRVTFVSSLALPDDIYLEEILQDGKPAFVVYDKKTDTWTIEPKIKVGKMTYKPIPVTKNLLKSLILPDGIEEYGTLTDLRKEMHDFALDEYDPVDSELLYLLIIDMLLTSWISPDWQENMAEKFIPIINPRGGSETGKKRFLTVTRWLTYHSRYILKTDRIPSVYRCLMPWNATLIMDEADLKDSKLDSEMTQFLNSRCDGVGIPRYDTHTRKIDDLYS
ncbi:unnamed protein product, partial [marine sediment metagenome]